MMRRAVVWTLLVVAAAAACSDGDRRAEPYRPPALYRQAVNEPGIGRGRELFLRDCAFCHGNRGQGTDRGPEIVTGTNGPAMLDFMLSSGRMPVQSERSDIERSPAIYSEDEIADIVAYIDSELDPEGPDIPEVDLAGADLALGQQLYQENCAACHSPTGIGGALVTRHPDLRNRVIIPGIGAATPTEVAEAMRVGPGTMPVFGPGTLSDADLEAVVAYVDYLQSPEDRGGTGIGHVGPVAEGAVGWIVGVGLLLVVVFWIGTTTRHKP
jgi:ubiquinol-cytochrome c reductase cytochrome c subunit